MNARIEKLRAAKEKAQRDKQKSENKLKNIKKQIAAATRKERTKRLCTRGRDAGTFSARAGASEG